VATISRNTQRRRLIATFTAALLLTGCHAFSQHDLSSFSITLARTACEGTCPVYEVTIRGDGRVEYAGQNQVDIPGRQKAQVQAASLAPLLRIIDNIHFFGMRDKYFETCTDLPTAILSVHLDGKSKQVSNYYGDCEHQTSGPQVGLARFAEAIDSVAGTARWIHCDEACIQELLRTGFDINAQGPDGATALLLAARKGAPGKVRRLLATGAAVDLRDAQGTTPLMEAIIRNHPDIAHELVANGADVNAKDKKGFAVLAMTVDPGMRRLLLKAGAK